MSKFSISLSDADRSELEAQAQALGKTKTAHATDMLLAGLSGGDSTIQALDLSRAQLRATELKLRKTTRLLRDGKVAEVLGTATGPAWSSALLGPEELRTWWTKLAGFVGGVVDAYGVLVTPGWWLDRYLVEALAAAAAWWHELEEPGGDAAAGPSDKVSFLRWVGGREDVRAIAAAHTASLTKPREGLTAKKQQEEQVAFKAFVDGEVNQRRARPRPGVPPVEVGEDGMTDFARMVEGKEDMFARIQKEHDASEKRDRPGVDHAAIEAEAARRASEEA